jgi:hypothetical protein
MRLTDNLGLLLLGIWLIVMGLLSLLNVSIPGLAIILDLLAIAAGVLILLRPARVSRTIGVILLGVWLVATGLLPLLAVAVPALALGLLAILAGLFILLGR